MWLTPKLISECTPNFNFFSNHKGDENYQNNENHPDNKNEGNDEGNDWAKKYMLKVEILVSLW